MQSQLSYKDQTELKDENFSSKLSMLSISKNRTWRVVRNPIHFKSSLLHGSQNWKTLHQKLASGPPVSENFWPKAKVCNQHGEVETSFCFWWNFSSWRQKKGPLLLVQSCFWKRMAKFLLDDHQPTYLTILK